MDWIYAGGHGRAKRKLPGVDIIFYKATALGSELLVDIMEQRNTAIQRIAIQFQRAVKLGVKRLAHLLVPQEVMVLALRSNFHSSSAEKLPIPRYTASDGW